VVEPAGKTLRVEEAQLLFREQELSVDAHLHRLLLVSPTAPVVLGRDRLARIRRGDVWSDVDQALVTTAGGWEPSIDAVVFLAKEGGDRYWCFAEDLDAAEVEELGYEMVKSQLQLYRGLVHAGVYSLTGIELPDREYGAFRRGTEKVAAELERELVGAARDRAAVLRLDLWLLDHLALWSTMSRERFFAGPLPEILSLIQRRRRQLEDMRRDIVDSGQWGRS
jgi:hypothetical protein